MTVYPDKQDTALKDLRKQSAGKIDGVFLFLTLMLLAVGLVMLMSASYARAFYEKDPPFSVITHQFEMALISIVVLFIASLFPEKFFQKIATPLLLATTALLALVLIIGQTGGGGKRWIDFGFVEFQPSELAKFSVILSYAKLTCVLSPKLMKLHADPRYSTDSRFRFRTDLNLTVIPYVLILMIVCMLLVAEPHVSACVIFVIITGGIMLQAGTKFMYLLILIAIAAVAAVVMYKTGFPRDYIKERVIVWRDTWAERPVIEGDSPEAIASQEWHKIAEDKGHQTRQSLIAIGSGGLTGLGLGQSRQKHLYLPEEHNDFIFAVVCEELGFIGAVLIMILFALLIVRGYWLALHSASKFSALVIGGITTQIAIQVVLNVAVVTNLFPATGISLPFFSDGGTALICQMGAIGIILALSKNKN
ncbi:MAG: FtsW/RodA/SpoVE family cell cycle protein [Oscillospiraceae bacterium]|jgi:cell division protein FtsW|nr:FtsW/RodA/SpoVE family cell cycle protein [Oscillospiraceae bacterium]